MAYTIKPSIGMLPIDDIDKVMTTKGYIKALSKDMIRDITQTKDSVTGAPVAGDTGITDPTRIAVCEMNSTTGIPDRTTIRNALNLNGHAATDYLMTPDKQFVNEIIAALSRVTANEIQLLKDELYLLKQELVRTSTIKDTCVNDGFIDGFRANAVKYDEGETGVLASAFPRITLAKQLFSTGDWCAVRYDGNIIDNNDILNVTKGDPSAGSDIEVSAGSGTINTSSMLLRTLGQYNRGTFSFSEIVRNIAGVKDQYTMLNDDSNTSDLGIQKDFTGYAMTLKIPKRNVGFLKNFRVYGKPVGNPGPLKAYLIEGDGDYLLSTNGAGGINVIESDRHLLAVSTPINANDPSISGSSRNEELIFDFVNYSYDPNDPTSTLYYELHNEIYTFLVFCENATDTDYWDIEMGSKVSTSATTQDLETNNRLFKFADSRYIHVGDPALANGEFQEIDNMDMLYVIITNPIVDLEEKAFSKGLYTVDKPIPGIGSRARVILEVNKEGAYIVTTGTGVVQSGQEVSFTDENGNNPPQGNIGAGDKVIIGNKITTAQSATPGRIQVANTLYLETGMPIYRCGYEVQLKTYRVEEDPTTKDPSIVPGSEEITPLNLIAVLPSGRQASSGISDRLVFEADFPTKITDKDPRFNWAQLQIKWKSSLNVNVINASIQDTDPARKTDYFGRIFSLALAFDKTIGEIDGVPGNILP